LINLRRLYSGSYVAKWGSKSFKTLLVASMATIIAFSVVSPSFASSVVYTYTGTDLGQGGWGGGALFASSSVAGNNGISFNNGGDIGTFTPSTWFYSDSSGAPSGANVGYVNLCGALTVIKTDGLLPPPGVYSGLCFTDLTGSPLPITGGPVNFFGVIIRVTPTGLG
jgi:hypothetical protein